MKPEDLANWMREEHGKVEQLARRLQEHVGCVPNTNRAHWIEVAQKAFEHFRAHVTKHMALEEKDGYMSSVVERRPALSKEVDRLIEEHKAFTLIMDNIHHVLQTLRPEQSLLIRDCCHRIRSLLSYIEHHEKDENLMVISVFTDDIGTKD